MEIINNPISDIEDYIENSDRNELPELNIVIIRNITIEPIKPYLEYLSLCMEHKLNLKFGEYDNVIQDVLTNTELLQNDTDCVMVFLKLETLSPSLAYKFTELDNNEVHKEVELVKSYIHGTLSGIRSRVNALISWHGFELPLYPAFGMIDFKDDSMQIAVINELNNYVKEQLSLYENCFYIDLNNIRSLVGAKQYYDNRYWHIGKAPFTLDALKEISMSNFRLLRALKGKNKKCLVLDCDNTLWGGIIGEDGLSGIKLSTNHPGSPFYEFQQEILSLYHRGIIIALCSKNNEDDVWNVLDNHPDMLIKRKHISTAQINWQNKAQNIQQIALDLNIGMESLVFIDDNEFEINLVNEMLPDVQTIHLPKGKSVEYKTILASCGYFDTLSYTNEDKDRGLQYKAESIRKNHHNNFCGNIDSYLESLEMEVSVDIAEDFQIPRIAQLTQKTNQFNLTTKRYSESDIKDYCEQSDYEVFTMKLNDRFGDLGIIGCSIINITDKNAVIDTFLLSCRAIGRGIETVLLNSCIEKVRSNGVSEINAFFKQTNKNSQVKNFYENHNFIVIEQNDEEGHFTLGANDSIPKNPSYFKHVKTTN